jgi:hypothetical protein
MCDISPLVTVNILFVTCFLKKYMFDSDDGFLALSKIRRRYRGCCALFLFYISNRYYTRTRSCVNTRLQTLHVLEKRVYLKSTVSCMSSSNHEKAAR